MAQKRKTDQTKLITDAALELADQAGWDAVTLSDLARKTKLPLATVETYFSKMTEVIQQVLKTLEDDTIDAVGEYLGDDWRDNLMELLMMRFEIVQRHRTAYKSLAKTLAKHPKSARHFAKGFYEMLDRLLLTAGLDNGKCQPLAVAGLAGIYLSLVDTWVKDETPDISKTMATIDKRLDWLEQGLNLVNKN